MLALRRPSTPPSFKSPWALLPPRIMRAWPYSLLFLVAAPLSFAQTHREVLFDFPHASVVPYAVSDDGMVIAGTLGVHQACRWSPAGVWPLSQPPGVTQARVMDMSGDGRQIIGNAAAAGGESAVLWVELAAPEVLPTLPQTFWSLATGISADGSAIVGSNRTPQGATYAVRWLGATAVEDLGSLGGTRAEALDVSADGSVVVGEAEGPANDGRAFRWTPSLGMVDLGFPGPRAMASKISHDGSVIIGRTITPGRDQLIRWNAATGPLVLATSATDSSEFEVVAVSADGTAALWMDVESQPLVHSMFYWSNATGVLPLGNNLRLTALSMDGLVASGWTRGAGPTRAVRWSPSAGLAVLDAEASSDAVGSLITPDGSTIVGLSKAESLTRWRDSSEIGSAYCGPAVPNSTGQHGALVATGTNTPQFGPLVLSASSLPTSAFGYFLASTAAMPPTPVVQSQGLLCLGGEIGRFVGPGQILNSGPTGEFQFTLPTHAMATPTGLVSVQHGETWHFQAWYRDANPQITSNFTNLVLVTFY